MLISTCAAHHPFHMPHVFPGTSRSAGNVVLDWSPNLQNGERLERPELTRRCRRHPIGRVKPLWMVGGWCGWCGCCFCSPGEGLIGSLDFDEGATPSCSWSPPPPALDAARHAWTRIQARENLQIETRKNVRIYESDRMPEDLPDRMSERMSDRMSEHMSYRMSK